MRKFKIPVIPESTNKSIRFPNDVIDEVEEAIRGTNCTFSAFVIEAVRVALNDLKDEEWENKISTNNTRSIYENSDSRIKNHHG